MSKDVQENFISICHNFVSTGITKLCSVVRNIVTDRTKTVGLHQKYTLGELEAVFTDILNKIRNVDKDDNIFTNSGIYFLPATDDFLKDLDSCDKDSVKEMLAETLDVFESEDVLEACVKLCRQGLSHIMDSVGEYFHSVSNAEHKDQVKNMSKDSLNDSGFVSPATVSLPFAKIIPILSSQIKTESDDDDDLWLWHLSENPISKTLGANIFESFSQVSMTSQQPSNQGWSDWMFSTVDQLFR